MLIESLTRIADSKVNLPDRRQALVCALGVQVGASAGIWAWGRGGDKSDNPVPVAQIHFGFDPQRLAAYIAAVIAPETDREFRTPMILTFSNA